MYVPDIVTTTCLSSQVYRYVDPNMNASVQFESIIKSYSDPHEQNFSLAMKYENDEKFPVLVAPMNDERQILIHRQSWTCYEDPGQAIHEELKCRGAERFTQAGVVNIPEDKHRYQELFKLILLGHAIGDAFGGPFENWQVENIDQISRKEFTSRWKWGAGTFTDDFSQGLILMESLINMRGLDGRDFYEKLIQWQSNGHMAGFWETFGQGRTLKNMVSNAGKMDIAKSPSFGNGSIMRISPVILFYMFHDIETLMDAAAASTLCAYPNVSCRDSARLLASIIHYIFHNDVKEGKDLLHPKFYETYRPYWEKNRPSAFLAEVVHDLTKTYRPSFEGVKEGADLKNTSMRKDPSNKFVGKGYLTDISAHCTLIEAINALITTDNLMDGLMKAINTRDSDTVAAVYMMMALPIYGINDFNGLPSKFVDTVYAGPAIKLVSEVMFDLAVNHNVDLRLYHRYVASFSENIILDGVINDNGQLIEFNPKFMPIHLQRHELPDMPFPGAQCLNLGDLERIDTELKDIFAMQPSETCTKPEHYQILEESHNSHFPNYKGPKY